MPPMIGDLNQDGRVDGIDLTTLLSGWGGSSGDVNGDGNTDGLDLAGLLSNWG
ncbi:MAG: Dockerin type domain [Planctomycetota bacterium]